MHSLRLGATIAARRCMSSRTSVGFGAAPWGDLTNSSRAVRVGDTIHISGANSASPNRASSTLHRSAPCGCETRAIHARKFHVPSPSAVGTSTYFGLMSGAPDFCGGFVQMSHAGHSALCGMPEHGALVWHSAATMHGDDSAPPLGDAVADDDDVDVGEVLAATIAWCVEDDAIV